MTECSSFLLSWSQAEKWKWWKSLLWRIK